MELNPGPTAQVAMLFAALDRPFPGAIRDKALNYILRTQNSDGGWSPFWGAASEVSLTCECYMGMRLLGVPATDDRCVLARKKIAELGGIWKANAWTQLYSAILGILPWESVYRTPVEIVLLDSWAPISLQNMSYWVKVITVPMALLGSVGPGKPISIAAELRGELEVFSGEHPEPRIPGWINKISSLAAKMFPNSRARAIGVALEQIENFREAHGDFGGNTCTALNVLLAMHRMGMEDDPRFSAGLRALLNYAVEDATEWRVQTCQSHIWDTGFALNALAKNDSATALAAHKGADWLKSQQILQVKGDWSRTVNADPGAWCFGDRHQHFPVTDCTALAFKGIVRHQPEFLRSPEGEKAIRWLCAMQHEKGGWSAYEKYTRGAWLNKIVRFKDIDNALTDLPKNDVSAKVLEALTLFRDIPKVEKSLQLGRKYLLSSRNSKGLWPGNYGIHFIYGTCFSVVALREIDKQVNEEWAALPRQFLLKSQNTDGGWGESEKSYHDPQWIGRGPSTVVQTSWALLGLLACYRGSETERTTVERAVNYLIREQKSDGSWHDPYHHGTVFPGLVYFRYQYYESYFPIMALEAAKNIL